MRAISRPESLAAVNVTANENSSEKNIPEQDAGAKSTGILGVLDNIKLAKKLPVFFIISALITGLSIGLTGFFKTQTALETSSSERLEALVQSRKNNLVQYLDSIKKDLHFNAENPFIKEALYSFSYAWNELGGNQTNTLQRLYIDDNPNPTGEKEKLDFALDGSIYSSAHQKYHPWIREFLYDRGYYDIFLFDLQGNLVYSVFKELDYATNLNVGEWKDSDLGNAFRSAAEAEKDSYSFLDFKPYAPSHGAAASFISTPVFDNGNKIGVLVYQMPIDGLNGIMQASDGLGKTGEISIFGADGLMRNDSRFSEESTILKVKANTSVADYAINGKSGTEIGKTTDTGTGVLAAYDYLDFLGTRWAVVGKIETDEVFAPVRELRNSQFLQALLIISLVAALGIWFGRVVSKKVNALALAANQLANKETNIEIPCARQKDELGDMATSMVTLKDAVNQNLLMNKMTSDYPVIQVDMAGKVEYINDAAANVVSRAGLQAKTLRGSTLASFHEQFRQFDVSAANGEDRRLEFANGEWLTVKVNPLENNGKVNGAYLNLRVATDEVHNEQSIELAQESVQNLIEKARHGQLNERIDAEQFTGFYRNLALSMNGLMDTMLQPIGDCISTLEQLSQGDLSNEMEGDYEGDFANMQNSLNATIGKLRDLVTEIRSSADNVSMASSEIATASTDLAQRTEDQAASLQRTTESMQQLTGNVKENATDAGEACDIAAASRISAHDGQEAVTKTVDAMQSIHESAQKIVNIITVIDEIAFQTNLLALNASVEAARAGEAGKGFAVVADEVRTLAARSSDASKEIKDLITEASDKVERGVDVADQSGESLKAIMDSVQKLANLVDNIAQSCQTQAGEITQINGVVTDMDESTQQNAAMVEENTAASRQMADQAQQLQNLIRFFKLQAA